MGFDDPVAVQYVRFLKGAVRGDFGESLRHGEPAMALVLERLPATFELAGAGLLIALGLAIPAGIVSAVRRNTSVDYVSTVVALLGQAMPTFWLGIMLILVFSVRLNWLPSSGRGGIEHLILPAITLGLFTTARITRLTRSGMLEVLGQDYIRTARAKGVGEPPVVWKHALKNASIPIVTIVGIELGTCWRLVITETIFAWPGWALSVQAIFNRDYPGRCEACWRALRDRELPRDLHLPRSAHPVPLMAALPPSVASEAVVLATPHRSAAEREWVTLLRRLVRRRTALFGMLVVLGVLLAAAFAPLVAPFDPLEQDIGQRLREPGWQDAQGRVHPLGTDHLGRDILSRIVFGSRIALVVGLAAVLISGLLGMLIGLLAGYFGGRVDDFLMRLADIQLAFPFILLAIAVIGVLGPSLRNIIIVIGVSSWVVYARVVRGEVLSIREREYVQAAIALGSQHWRVLRQHVLPNTLTPWLVVATLDMARVIVIESALSFLGLGVQPPTPTWGGMLADGRVYLSTAWWLATFPGLAILITVLGINLFGDGLRDTLDPRLKV
jgi:peptide/nickel transport system permease protein